MAILAAIKATMAMIKLYSNPAAPSSSNMIRLKSVIASTPVSTRSDRVLRPTRKSACEMQDELARITHQRVGVPAFNASGRYVTIEAQYAWTPDDRNPLFLQYRKSFRCRQGVTVITGSTFSLLCNRLDIAMCDVGNRSGTTRPANSLAVRTVSLWSQSFARNEWSAH